MNEYIAKCNEVVGISGKTLIVPDYIDTSEEIVRCRDCKRIEYCRFYAKDKDKPNGFCAWGVRKEVDA